MATAAQMIANQANAQSSTGAAAVASAKEGPRTEAGKASSARNATTHGLSAKSFVIVPGQEEAFTTFESDLRAEFQPQGMYQGIFFKEILHASWNLERCHNAEAQLQAESADPGIDPLLVEANAAKLRLIATYASRAERSLYRATKELRQLQTEARYREEHRQDADPVSPLVDTQNIDRQSAANLAKLEQAALNEVRAFCEAPTPGDFADKTGPRNVPGQTKPLSMGDLLVMKIGR